MKCVLCSKEMEHITTSFQSKWGDYEITIDGLKAHQCKQCQRIIFEPEVARMIQNITAGFSERPPSERPDMINVNDVADLLSVSNQTVYNMIRDGRLKATKIGREWRFLRHEIEGMLIARERSVPFSLAARNCEGLSERDQAIIERHLEELRRKEQEKGG